MRADQFTIRAEFRNRQSHGYRDPHTPRRYLNREEAAAWLDVSVDTFSGLAVNGGVKTGHLAAQKCAGLAG